MASNMTTIVVHLSDLTTEEVFVAPASSSSSSGVPGTRIFRIYGLVSAEVLGMIFNTLTIFVFLRTPLRQSGLYLFALAIGDNLALLAEFIRWFSQGTYMGLHWMDDSNTLCKVVNHLRYGSRLFSAFITMTITIERYLAVAHPFKAAAILRRRSTKIIIIIEFFISLLMSSYSPFLFELVERTGGHPGCSIKRKNSLAYSKCNWIISKAIGEVTTSLIVFFFTLLIIKALLRAMKFRKEHSSGSDPKKASNVDTQLTLMLLNVAIVFFVTRAPYTITYYLSHNREIFGGSRAFQSMMKYRIRRVLDVTFFFYTLNHSVNFFLYCLSGSKFRLYLAMAFGKQEVKPFATSIMSLSGSVKVVAKDDSKVTEATTKT